MGLANRSDWKAGSRGGIALDVSLDALADPKWRVNDGYSGQTGLPNEPKTQSAHWEKVPCKYLSRRLCFNMTIRQKSDIV